MFCPDCGAAASGGNYCGSCGSSMQTPQRQDTEPAPSETGHTGPLHSEPIWSQPAPRGRSAVPVALAGAAAGVVIVLLVTIVIMLRDDGTPTAPAAGSAFSPTLSSTASPSSRPSAKPDRQRSQSPARQKSATAVRPGPGDVRALPAGLFCRDLHAGGYSYTAAVDYWRAHGQPNQMDADRNGVPCETVYPPGDVGAYWGGRSVPAAQGLPGGLFCRDLYARGVSYSEAVAYWWSWNLPDRMDVDLNGIPCETVYPAADVNAFWYP